MKGKILRGLLPLLLLVPSASEAGVRASYRLEGEKTPVRIEVADNGDASFTVGAGDLRIAVIGGQTFSVVDGDDGLEVFRFLDVAAVLRKAGPLKLDEPLPVIARSGRPSQIAPLGDRTIKGKAARVFRVSGIDPANPTAAVEVSVLADPVYRPMGVAFARVLEDMAGLVDILAVQSPGAAELVLKLGGVARLGAPLAMPGLYALETIETVPLSPTLIALPASPTDPTVLIRRLREAQDTDNAERDGR